MTKAGGGLPDETRWFEKFNDKVFDWLEIPKDEFGTAFRKIGTVMILRGLRSERLSMPDGREGPYVRCDHFSDEVRSALRTLRYRRPFGSSRVSVSYLDCHTCHQQAWDFSRAISFGYVHWKSMMSPVAIKIAPVKELLRNCESENPRDWPAIWRWAGGKLCDGRMIAHSQDAVWVKLSRFGIPWSPFEIGSGMGTRSIWLREAKEMGLSLEFEGTPVVTGWWDLRD